ncbi:hypothetical protein ACSE5K_10200 [Bacillus velezensis]|uniref:hypothetical protein n=1 Tax=Bacillus TaxID=1386 RepID=UPI0004588266|nr:MULTISPECIES: hypothetical protein [Bacillus]AIW37816.1 hypothetical protein KS07_10095 [Bacillus subtilis]AHZ16294.1 hypothetical protein V529_22680 [Bacillus velezensis SQR9]AKF76280.1 hypothetical protein AAV30_08945 [Bacillus velezensis]AKF76320.1 hypothetical protein AAV30_09205 [Bacillus velezensis]AWD15484.1 hypothetical protein B9C53_19260 [Bacillus velezensis]
MEFRVYQLTYANDLTEKTAELYEFLKNYGRKYGERDYYYTITNEIDEENHVITLCFSEEHDPIVNALDEENNSYAPDIEPCINTIMAFDLREKRFLVQNRDYPADNLKKETTMTRIGLIMEAAFQEVYNSEFNYLDTDREINEDTFRQAFERYRVSTLWVKIPGTRRFLYDYATIFSEDRLNRPWIEAWNADESGMHEILLKAPGKGGDGDLRNSPVAKSVMNMFGVEVKQLDFWDEEGKFHKISSSSLKRFNVKGIDHRTLVITAIQHTSLAIRNRRTELRDFVASSDL